MEELQIETGNVYRTQDGRSVMVYNYNTVHNTFDCVVVDKGEFFSVYPDGKYYETRESNNDLVEKIK